MTPAPDALDCLRSQVDALHSVIGLLVAVVALSPLTDDDDKVEIQRRWAALNEQRG